ncbi:MAG: hypothetical protein V4795_24035 [Pseudomonadota bacterium]
MGRPGRQDEQATDPVGWLRQLLLRWFPGQRGWIVGGLAVLGLLGLLVMALPPALDLLSRAAGARQPAVEVVAVSPASDALGRHDLVLRNNSDLPVLVSAFGIEVLAAVPSAAVSAGQAMLPVQEGFDVRLPSQAGSTVLFERTPTQLPPRAMERFQFRLSAVAMSNEAWIDYRLRLVVRAGAEDLARSEPFSARVIPAVR